MKIVLCCVVFAVTIITTSATSCHQNKIKCYEATVNGLVNNQIAVELKGQYTYLYLSHFFMQHDRFYPKVSKYFREKSNEEMQHAERFIEYQNQRGGTFNIEQVTRKTDGSCASVTSLESGFACAKELEIDVTRALSKLLADVSDVVEAAPNACPDINREKKDLLLGQSILVTIGEVTAHLKNHVCDDSVVFDKVEYVELAEMIAHDFLGHQIEDTKEIANFEATLKGFEGENEKLGSFLADKHFEL